MGDKKHTHHCPHHGEFTDEYASCRLSHDDNPTIHLGCHKCAMKLREERNRLREENEKLKKENAAMKALIDETHAVATKAVCVYRKVATIV